MHKHINATFGLYFLNTITRINKRTIKNTIAEYLIDKPIHKDKNINKIITRVI